MYYLYILSNKYNTTFYIGITNSLERRIYEHVHRLIPGFTSQYNVSKLVYFEEYIHVKDCIQREKQLKNWHRSWKINLIKLRNPQFKNIEILK